MSLSRSAAAFIMPPGIPFRSSATTRGAASRPGECRVVHSPSIDYAGVGLAATAGWAGVPGLGETALIAAGVLAAHGQLDIAEVVAVAFVGAAAGGVAGWLLGMKHGARVVGGA